MQVKQIERTANLAWSPRNVLPVYLATGTAAQQLDASFSTSAALEVFALNLQDPGNDLTLVNAAPIDQRLHTVIWDKHGGTNGTIVGGSDNGVIQIFNADKLLNKEDGILEKLQKHTGNVRALDFNKYQSNLLASGAAESEIYIWDLNNPGTPMSPGTRVQPPEDVTSLQWNNQVQHILATAFPSRCVVWDLRKNEPIIKLTDTSCRLRWCSLAWNPDVATQLCLASEDDQSPFIQMWDLRFATSPVKVLAGHQKGVLSLSWSTHDTEMLLSCGKDNKILCWNPNETSQGQELICDMTSPSQWNFAVSWCPRNPALFSTCSFDGHVSVNSLVGGPQQPQTSTKIADSFPGMELYPQAPLQMPQSHPVTVDLRKPPKWLKRPATARFGFGGKLVITEQKIVTLCQVTSEPGVVARANILDAAVRLDNCLEYCQGKVAASLNDDEKTLWQFLSASFSQAPKEEFISLLGFQRQDITSKLNQLRLRNGPADKLTTLGRSTDTESDLDASDDVTESRSSTFGQDGSETIGLPRPAQRVARSYKISTTDDVDGLICEALLLGDTAAAVELCVEDARWADAIILAMTGGPDLLATTQHRYLQENPGILSKLVLAAVTEDWQPVVENCDPSSWREALVAAITHSPDEFPPLCESLGARLHPRFAQLCYLCAGNIDRLVAAWLQVNKAALPENLQDLVEVIMMLKRAVELRGRQVNISGQVAEILSRYAILLASEGNLEMALAYLETSQDEGMAFLRERIYRAAGLGGQQSKEWNSQGSQVTQHQDRATRSGYPAAQQPSVDYSNYGSHAPTYPPAQIAEPVPVAASYNPAPTQRRISNPPLPSSASEGTYGHGTRTASPAFTSGKSMRAKHVLDPSVASSQNPAAYYPTSNIQGSSFPAPQQGVPAPAPYGSQSASAVGPAFYAATPAAPSPYGFNPAAAGNQQAPPLPPTALSSQPPGWNDPPPLTSRTQVREAQHAGTRKWREMIAHSQNKEISAPAAAPITTPLFGGPQPPAPSVNGMYDPYQQRTAQPPPSFPTQQPGQPPSQPNYQPSPLSFPPQSTNAYPQTTPNTFTPQQPYGSFPAQTPAYPPPSQTPVNTFPPPTAPNHFMPAAPSAQPTPPPPQPQRKAIPEEHLHLQTVFDELKNRCIAAATSGPAKRKLDEIARKLESMYESLADKKLSPGTLQALHGIGQRVQNGDYTGSLSIHSELVSGPDFAQIASFMPGVKSLLQTALQLQVYL